MSFGYAMPYDCRGDDGKWSPFFELFYWKTDFFLRLLYSLIQNAQNIQMIFEHRVFINLPRKHSQKTLVFGTLRFDEGEAHCKIGCRRIEI